MYFQDKLINSNKKIILKNLQNPEDENHLAVEFSELQLRVTAIKALSLYSKYLVRIYNDDLKNLTLASIESMADNVINFSTKDEYLLSRSDAIATTSSKIADILIEKKRYSLLKKYVNKTNPKIEEYLKLLDDETVNILQSNIEFETKQILERNINDYNRYLLSESSFTKFNNEKELLRQNQINTIKYDYELYLTVQNRNPQKVIKGLQSAQQELFECVNNPKKNQKNLMEILEEIHVILGIINKFLP